MKIELWGRRGRKGGGWAGSAEHEADVDPELRACPFCRGRDVEVTNTYTPFYHVECRDCGASGPDSTEGYRWKASMGKAATRDVHLDAFHQAIDLWNDRPAP